MLFYFQYFVHVYNSLDKIVHIRYVQIDCANKVSGKQVISIVATCGIYCSLETKSGGLQSVQRIWV